MSLTAFVPLLVLEKPAAGKEKLKSGFQVLEGCGRNLYLGSRDGTIQHFTLLEPEGNQQTVRETRRKQLGSKDLITQMKVLPVLNHLLVLCNGSITALNMFSLEPVPTLSKIRNVSLMTVNDSYSLTQPLAVELFTLSSRRRAVSIHVVSVNKWECVKEVSLSQDPISLAVDGPCLCIGTDKNYILHDHNSGMTLDLVPHDSTNQRVIVQAVGKGEFLLNGPGSLGIFVNNHGISQRPPLQWSQGALAAVGYPPYVLALQSEGLFIYSMLDQHLKQTVPLHKAIGLLSTTESVFVFTEREVYNLLPVPLDEQITALVNSERVDEALELLQGAKGQLSKDTYETLQKDTACTAGFVKFYQGCFQEAKELFIKGDIDPREIISLYPDLPSLGDGFTSQLAAVFNSRDLRAMRTEDYATFQRYQEFLGGFLSVVRGTDQSHGHSQNVDCTLLKLYAEGGCHKDLDQLLSSGNDCLLDMCAPYLEKNKRFFSLGLLYQSHGQTDDAVQTWVKAVDGFLPDSSCPDIYGHIVKFLSQQKCRKFLWKYADWILQRDQEIFTNRGDSQESLLGEDIEFLTKYPKALELYLEHLVKDFKSKEEKYHTLLATTYVDHILRDLEHGQPMDTTTRHKLQQFLQESTFYSAEDVQEALKCTPLYVEKAILHGRAGEPLKALEVLVHKAKDQQAAEDYCRRTSEGQSTEFINQLYLTLLGIYLQSPDLLGAAVDLLNGNSSAFSLVDVLQVLPDSWSLQLVDKFLIESLRWNFHSRRMRWIEKNLAQAEYHRHKIAWIIDARGMMKVEKWQLCQRCGRYLMEPIFLRSPKGELIHKHCGM
ncbi:transforming growth factor-beta receptor-associated protein 1 [Brienomyrus brachyistius]|uniref:transforming growth factor-beta receptor-associated protein 1 n=1 Tax=Brienomyrus brachyistius TaxID=42636 RepID=UPI0020B24B1A|nr:transforming growth factor-beta receptor-associated protein 1 [Brienomyrus brachyistius]